MSLEFQDIRHSFGQNNILDQLSVTAHAGEILCLLGHSGSGKTTLLRLAAGLEQIQGGRILLYGQCLAKPGHNPPPESRPVGLMFQDQVLFPHMTVAENIAFGLQGRPRQEQKTIIDQRIKAVGLKGFEPRYPHTLSGGEQQRVALARALAPNPKVLLMDEPFASIDVTLRRALREQTRQLVSHENVTTLLVTHDPEEALELSDRIAIIAAGKIVQCGTPQEIYQHPAEAAVARLFGGAQNLTGRLQNGRIETPFGQFDCSSGQFDCSSGQFDCSSGQFDCSSGKNGDEFDIVVRPGAVILQRVASGAHYTIIDVRFRGDAELAYILPTDAGEGMTPLRAQIPHGADFNKGVGVNIKFDRSKIFIFAK